VLITGNGGGKWYNYHTSEWGEEHGDFRCIKIKDTKEPLYFYNFEPQHVYSGALAELSNTENITVYGVKTECSSVFMRIINSTYFRIYGHGGLGNPAKGEALYIIDNCDNYIITYIADQANLKQTRTYQNQTQLNIMDFFPLKERHKSGDIVMDPLSRPLVYKREAVESNY